MAVKLYDYQLDAVSRMTNGCILCGGVGSGKSRTALAYYHTRYGGELNPFKLMDQSNLHNLFIITTAKKRDSFEWERDMAIFLFNLYEDKLKVTIDSWNNIGKYSEVQDGFFIFDEQRLVGKGAWVKAFLKIAKSNEWVLLSATPGDTWMDYVPVFIANGFYRNRTEFNNEHVKWKPYTKFPQVDRYYNTGRLIRLRNKILVDMDFERKTVSHHIDIYCDYNSIIYKDVYRDRVDPWTDEPFQNAAGLCQCLRKVVNSDPNRVMQLIELMEKVPRAIIFYNYDYELELLKETCSSLLYNGNPYDVAEWNGHKHQEIPESDRWVYLVQYNAGNEGWNCVRTDTIIFYSSNYSYKVMVQAAGRIDRLNTPYSDLYYYHFKSRSGIDLAIDRALKAKKNFNEGKFAAI